MLLCRRYCCRLCRLLWRHIWRRLGGVLHRRSGKADKVPGDFKLLIFGAQAFKLETEYATRSRGQLATYCPTRRTADSCAKGPASNGQGLSGGAF
jgi:hypothetical protein